MRTHDGTAAFLSNSTAKQVGRRSFLAGHGAEEGTEDVTHADVGVFRLGQQRELTEGRLEVLEQEQRGESGVGVGEEHHRTLGEHVDVDNADLDEDLDLAADELGEV
jgi:hypothetical protein